MKIARRTLVLTSALFLTMAVFGDFFWYRPKFKAHPKANTFAFEVENLDGEKETMLRLNQKVLQAKNYIAGHNFNATHYFLLDMRIASGKNRFFVYNLPKDSVEIAGLVAHGSGTINSKTPIFSNAPNSYCSSLGKYKIGNAYNGKFGLAYKLYGLDNTNSKAFDRFVVLHAHACVPNEEVAPFSICESWGCPTVAPAFLTQLKSYLDKSEDPVLLWIYY